MWPFGRKAATAPRAVFKVYKGGDDQWRWSLMLDATIVADGSKDRKFRRRADCLVEVEAIRAATGGRAGIEVERV